jgi:hypothetical protein
MTDADRQPTPSLFSDDDLALAQESYVDLDALKHQCLALLVSEMAKSIDEIPPRRPTDAAKRMKKLLDRHRRTSRQRKIVKPTREEVIAVRADLMNRIHELEVLASADAVPEDQAAFAELDGAVQERPDAIEIESLSDIDVILESLNRLRCPHDGA